MPEPLQRSRELRKVKVSWIQGHRETAEKAFILYSFMYQEILSRNLPGELETT